MNYNKKNGENRKIVKYCIYLYKHIRKKTTISYPENPISLQTGAAEASVNTLSHTVPHSPLYNTSTRPSFAQGVPASRTLIDAEMMLTILAILNTNAKFE